MSNDQDMALSEIELLEIKFDALKGAVGQTVMELKAECGRLAHEVEQVQRSVMAEAAARCTELEAKMLRHMGALERRLSAAERANASKPPFAEVEEPAASSPDREAPPISGDRAPDFLPGTPTRSTPTTPGSPMASRPKRRAPCHQPPTCAPEEKKAEVDLVRTYTDFDAGLGKCVLDHKPAALSSRELFSEVQLAFFALSMKELDIKGEKALPSLYQGRSH